MGNNDAPLPDGADFTAPFGCVPICRDDGKFCEWTESHATHFAVPRHVLIALAAKAARCERAEALLDDAKLHLHVDDSLIDRIDAARKERA